MILLKNVSLPMKFIYMYILIYIHEWLKYVLYLNYFIILFIILLFNNQNKNHTLMLLKIYTTLQYIILQYNCIQTSMCRGIIKNEIILLNLI